LALKEVGDQEKEAGQVKRCSARSPAFTDLDEAIEAATSLPFAFQASIFHAIENRTRPGKRKPIGP
jgi:hypothetical protein